MTAAALALRAFLGKLGAAQMGTIVAHNPEVIGSNPAPQPFKALTRKDLGQGLDLFLSGLPLLRWCRAPLRLRFACHPFSGTPFPTLSHALRPPALRPVTFLPALCPVTFLLRFVCHHPPTSPHPSWGPLRTLVASLSVRLGPQRVGWCRVGACFARLACPYVCILGPNAERRRADGMGRARHGKCAFGAPTCGVVLRWGLLCTVGASLTVHFGPQRGKAVRGWGARRRDYAARQTHPLP